MKYYSTAKLVSKAVKNSQIMRGVEFTSETLGSTLVKKDVHLLFPSANAVDCEEVRLNSDSTVVVIDGTWSEAGKIVRRNLALKSLPCITFKQPVRSNYRIRKQPKENYLSTIESVAHFLKRNAAISGFPDHCTYYDSLFDGFNRMIEQQLSYWPTRSTGTPWDNHIDG